MFATKLDEVLLLFTVLTQWIILPSDQLKKYISDKLGASKPFTIWGGILTWLYQALFPLSKQLHRQGRQFICTSFQSSSNHFIWPEWNDLMFYLPNRLAAHLGPCTHHAWPGSSARLGRAIAEASELIKSSGGDALQGCLKGIFQLENSKTDLTPGRSLGCRGWSFFRLACILLMILTCPFYGYYGDIVWCLGGPLHVCVCVCVWLTRPLTSPLHHPLAPVLV